ncbi:MAG: hypothetical protein JNK17_02185 [Hydrogenophaga sp.]|nr:hypothetical protein [Hydrogenophaga sp.]
MKAREWLGLVVKGAAGWQTYAWIAAGVVAVAGVAVAGVLVWFNGRIDAAHEAGKTAEKVEQMASDLSALKNVVDADKESNDAIAENVARLGGMAARVDELERVRRADAARVDGLVRSAPEPAVRAHAAQAERDIAVLEGQRDGFAEEAVQASTAAWGIEDTLQRRRDAIAAQRKALKPKE